MVVLGTTTMYGRHHVSCGVEHYYCPITLLVMVIS